jgi:hypothetical protein
VLHMGKDRTHPGHGEAVEIDPEPTLHVQQ